MINDKIGTGSGEILGNPPCPPPFIPPQTWDV